MTNANNRVVKNSIESVFESGFSNAAHSFAIFTNNKVFFNNFHHGLLDHNELTLNQDYQRYNQKPTILITTEVFGEVSGKSYLFLSEKDFELLVQNIPDSAKHLKDEFAKELDNILSAAVITKLSNHLHKKMYGDVPILVGPITSRLEDIIQDGFSKHGDNVYINSAFFSFESHVEVSPLFVWVFEKSLLYDNNEKILL
jgi:chemotaxis protein CheY-P-specific phosphatase CheC